MENKDFIIETENLSKYFPIETAGFFEKKKVLKAVDRVDLKIPRGCTFGLVGESGCGKSTLGEMICSLLKPTEGRIIFSGKDMSQMTKEERKEANLKIQMIFQDPYSSLNPKKRVGWILEEPLKVHTKLSPADRREVVINILQTVGLDDSYMDSFPDELSGGQRQRVSIAAALILEPEFIVADEAVSALDVSIQAQVLNLLRELQEKRALTYLFISHNLNVVEYMSDYIGVMYKGHLVEAGTSDDIYERAVHPYTKMLLASIPDISEEEKKELYDPEKFLNFKKKYKEAQKNNDQIDHKMEHITATHAVDKAFI